MVISYIKWKKTRLFSFCHCKGGQSFTWCTPQETRLEVDILSFTIQFHYICTFLFNSCNLLSYIYIAQCHELLLSKWRGGGNSIMSSNKICVVYGSEIVDSLTNLCLAFCHLKCFCYCNIYHKHILTCLKAWLVVSRNAILAAMLMNLPVVYNRECNNIVSCYKKNCS